MPVHVPARLALMPYPKVIEYTTVFEGDGLTCLHWCTDGQWSSSQVVHNIQVAMYIICGVCPSVCVCVWGGYCTADMRMDMSIQFNSIQFHQVFHKCAEKYDLMNDFMSGTLHRVWKDEFVRMAEPLAVPGYAMRSLDMAGGTGDIAFRLLEASKRSLGNNGPITTTDAMGNATTQGTYVAFSDLTRVFVTHSCRLKRVVRVCVFGCFCGRCPLDRVKPLPKNCHCRHTLLAIADGNCCVGYAL
jgi:hypothetical protein